MQILFMASFYHMIALHFGPSNNTNPSLGLELGSWLRLGFRLWLRLGFGLLPCVEGWLVGF